MKKKIFTIIISSFFAFFLYIYYELIRPLNDREININISKNSTASEILCIINNINPKKSRPLSSLIKILSLRKKIRRGSYKIPKNSNALFIIKKLFSGNQDTVKLTFSCAKNLEELVEQISKKLDLSYDELYNFITDEKNLEQWGFSKHNILTVFIPNTYYLYWTISVDDFMKRMLIEYKKFWNSEKLEKCMKIGLNQIEISILASIVQSETNRIDEAARISGVYINRLKRNIPICACPTVFFNLESLKRSRLLKKDLQIESDYNTYIRKGLPIGPICLPLSIYINAVLNAEKHNYMYFCAKEDFSGYHYFSTNLRDHINKSKKYKKELDKRKILY